MINQICSSCGELTGPAAVCEHCGGDPAAAEVECHECQGTCRVVRYAGRYRMNTVWVECEACYLSGRPGYVEAPYILERDAHAKLAYWMDCPLSEIPLRAPFKELREMIPESMLHVINEVKHATNSAPCACCGAPGSQCPGFDGEVVCAPCTWMNWGHHAALEVSKETARRVLYHGVAWRLDRWETDNLVPAGLSAGGEA